MANTFSPGSIVQVFNDLMRLQALVSCCLDGGMLGHPPRLRGEENGRQAHAFPYVGRSQGTST